MEKMRMEKWGQNEDDKMRMENCEWEYADRGEINLQF